jgi:hypothetical protein
MAKVTVNGETFDSGGEVMLTEALALEKGLGVPYWQWEQDLAAGSVLAMCGFIWLTWRRNGRQVELADILSGKVELNLATLAIKAAPQRRPRKASTAGKGG